MKICNRAYLLSLISSLLISLTIFILIILSYFTSVIVLNERIVHIFMNMANIFLILALSIVLFKEFVPRDSIYKEYTTIALLITLSIYSFIWSLIEISRLKPRSFIYIPPIFIIVKCPITQYCSSFGVLTISIPLGIALGILIYSIYKIIKTIKTFRAKDVSKIIGGINLQEMHNNI